MEKATKVILDALREKGYRVTNARERIIDALARSKSPKTIQALGAEVVADEASVYRTIALLRESSLVEEIAVSGDRPHYALAGGHHHHAVCTNCNTIVHLPASDYEPPVPSVFVSLEGHEVTYYGVCKKCG